jgi:uncharacterized protein GlcG (DUF336 family)
VSKLKPFWASALVVSSALTVAGQNTSNAVSASASNPIVMVAGGVALLAAGLCVGFIMGRATKKP